MQNKIPPQDWEVLSAYVDGQQKPRERARLEARLQSDSDLKTALAELQQTRGVLRAAPRLRAPRNFMLKPEMAGLPVRSNTKLYPAFRFASAVTSLLFAIIVLGDLTGIGSRVFNPLGGTVPQQMELSAQEDEAAPSMKMMEAPAAEEPALAAEVLAEESLAAKEMPIEAPAAESFASELPAAAAEAASPETRFDLTPVAEPITDAATDQVQGITKAEEESVTSSIPAALDELESGESGLTVGETQDEWLAGVQETEEYPPPDVNVDHGDRSLDRWPLFRIFEIALGVAVLILIAVTIYLRRQTF